MHLKLPKQRSDFSSVSHSSPTNDKRHFLAKHGLKHSVVGAHFPTGVFRIREVSGIVQVKLIVAVEKTSSSFCHKRILVAKASRISTLLSPNEAATKIEQRSRCMDDAHHDVDDWQKISYIG